MKNTHTLTHTIIICTLIATIELYVRCMMIFEFSPLKSNWKQKYKGDEKRNHFTHSVSTFQLVCLKLKMFCFFVHLNSIWFDYTHGIHKCEKSLNKQYLSRRKYFSFGKCTQYVYQKKKKKQK